MWEPADPQLSLGTLQLCEWTHCIGAPAPPANSSFDVTYNGAAYNFTGTEVEVGASVLYTCAGGMRGDPDFNFTLTSVECGEGNVWTPSAPSWPTCIDSESVIQRTVAVYRVTM